MNWTEIVNIVITAALTLGGFYFGKHIEAKRELRQAVRSITDKALEYWASAENEDSNAQSFIIVSHLEELELTLNGKAENELFNFRRAITDGDFQSIQRRIALPGSHRVKRINQSSAALNQSLQ
jgi:hypothetical protein